jgi:hypothetical protein
VQILVSLMMAMQIAALQLMPKETSSMAMQS